MSKKVILVSSTPPPMGGISKWTARMLQVTLPNDWQIKLVSDRIVGSRDCYGDDIKYSLKNEFIRWIGVWKGIWKASKDKDTYLVHTCPISTTPSMLVNIISGMVSKLCHKKYLIHFRCTVPYHITTRTRRTLLKILCRISDEIIVLNTQTKIFLEGLTNTPTILIPNFVTLDEISIKDKIISEKLKTIVYVGGVIRDKGCDHLVEVARQLPDIQFRMVGKVASEIIDLSNGVDNIVFTGVKNSEEVKDELANADAFIFLTRLPQEGFANAVTEAMAAGLPCIVTDWAANADQVDDTKGGFVIKRDIVNGAIEAIKRMSDSNIRQQQSKYNKEKVARQYSENRIIKQYIECYERLI